MKNIRYIGETPRAFGDLGRFVFGQIVSLPADIADRLIAKGFFEEIIKSKKDKGE